MVGRQPPVAAGLREVFLRLRRPELSDVLSRGTITKHAAIELFEKNGLTKAQAYYYLAWFSERGCIIEREEVLTPSPSFLAYLDSMSLSEFSKLELSLLLVLLDGFKTTAELSSEVGVVRQKVYKSITRLAQKKIVCSQKLLDDARKIVYNLTDFGRLQAKKILVTHLSTELMQTNQLPELVPEGEWKKLLAIHGLDGTIADKSISLMRKEGRNQDDRVSLHKLVWYPVSPVLSEVAARTGFNVINTSKTVDTVNALLDSKLGIGIGSLPALGRHDSKFADQVVILDILDFKNWMPVVHAGKGYAAYRSDAHTEEKLIAEHARESGLQPVAVDDEEDYFKGIMDKEYTMFSAQQPIRAFYNLEVESQVLEWHSVPLALIANKNTVERNLSAMRLFRKTLRDVLGEFNSPDALASKTKEYVEQLPFYSGLPPLLRNFRTLNLLKARG